jgi:hypothetical protein
VVIAQVTDMHIRPEGVLDLEDDHPLMFAMEPPACQLHIWRPGTGRVSHTSDIGEYDGPYRFSDGVKVVR